MVILKKCWKTYETLLKNCCKIVEQLLQKILKNVEKKLLRKCWKNVEKMLKSVEKMFIEISDLNLTISWVLRAPWSSCADPEVSFNACDTTVKPFHVLWMMYKRLHWNQGSEIILMKKIFHRNFWLQFDTFQRSLNNSHTIESLFMCLLLIEIQL